MTLLNQKSFTRDDLRMALIVTKREVRDSFRDWRIIIPIILLTLVFPALATFTARAMFRFVGQFGATLIGDRIVPFMLLIVGFFPMSFSLVIALETFVGEKERKSLEPLLSTPLTNTQLYVGKVLAAVIPPMVTSYLGIAVYLIGLLIFTEWNLSGVLFAQIILMTTLQGILMVAAAVIVSSQTTSVRAANLLASFIIVPVALLLQFEAFALFWANTEGLWWLILGLVVTAFIFFRTGIKLFNREELLGQDFDQLQLGRLWRLFWDRFSRRRSQKRLPGILQWYRQTLSILPSLKLPGLVSIVGIAGGVLVGVYFASKYSISVDSGSVFSSSQIAENAAKLQLFHEQLPFLIFLQNIRVIAIGALLGLFTIGTADILIIALPWSVISFLAVQMANVGEDPFLFIAAGILPHATLELPALIIVTAAALRWHMAVMARPASGPMSETWITAAADYFRLTIGLGVPMFLLSAFIEALITPRVLFWAFSA